MRHPWSLLVLLTLSVPAFAADDSGFESLFNGKDLTGRRFGKESLAGKTSTPTAASRWSTACLSSTAL